LSAFMPFLACLMPFLARICSFPCPQIMSIFTGILCLITFLIPVDGFYSYCYPLRFRALR
jgi:hypothetical protein